MLVCLDCTHLVIAASIDAVVKSRAASAVPAPDGAALLSERHVVTGWKVHSFTVSCHSAHTALSCLLAATVTGAFKAHT